MRMDNSSAKQQIKKRGYTWRRNLSSVLPDVKVPWCYFCQTSTRCFLLCSNLPEVGWLYKLQGWTEGWSRVRAFYGGGDSRVLGIINYARSRWLSRASGARRWSRWLSARCVFGCFVFSYTIVMFNLGLPIHKSLFGVSWGPLGSCWPDQFTFLRRPHSNI